MQSARGAGLVVAVGLLMAGCKYYDLAPAPYGPHGTASPRPGGLHYGLQFDDVPAPRHFVLDPESYASEFPPFRQGRWRYRGGLVFSQTVKFYEEQLPQLGWEPQGEPEESSGRTTLRYTGAGERERPESLEVRIFRQGDRTVVEIDLTQTRS